MNDATECIDPATTAGTDLGVLVYRVQTAI